jgi:hypothetical protein
MGARAPSDGRVRKRKPPSPARGARCEGGVEAARRYGNVEQTLVVEAPGRWMSVTVICASGMSTLHW